MTLQLHGHPFSSYTWKALIPLYANGTQFEFREMAGDRPLSEQFPGKVHPGGHIPVLVDGDTVVVEATSIVEHLAVHHPGPAPLIPPDPPQAVVARMLDRVFDNYAMGNMQRVVSAHFISRDKPELGLRDAPDEAEIAAARRGFGRPMRGSRGGCRRMLCRRTCRWSPAPPPLRYSMPIGSSPLGPSTRAWLRCAPSCWSFRPSLAASMTHGHTDRSSRSERPIATSRTPSPS